MTWPDANTWAANLSFHDAVNNITYDNWRLPTVKPVNGGVNFNYNNFTGTLDGSTDSGFNISEQGTIYAGSTGSEMAHLFYNTLDNKGYYAIICTNCSDPQPQAGWGLANTFPFTNLQAEVYWSGTDWDPYTANSWIFSFNSGYQGAIWKGDHAYASAVSPGDIGIAAVPEPGTYAMFLVGLGLLGVTAWRRNCTQKWPSCQTK